MALTDKSSIVVPKGFYGKANVLQGFNPQTENLVDLDVVRNTTATRVNEQGLIENVPANVPRRDFLNGGCGELLVEPQRTNSLNYSEEFDNAYWTTKDVLINANSATAPDGTASADKIVPNSTDAQHRITRNSQSIIGGSYSVFAKSDGLDFILLTSNPTGAKVRGTFFNISNGTIGNTAAGQNPKIENYGNGWYRCSIDQGDNPSSVFTVIVTNADNITNFLGNSTDGVLLWGAQNENGIFSTSYIPTTASAVTRNQDVISATNIGSLLNDAEGGIYVSLSWFNGDEVTTIQLNDNTKDNRVSLGSNDTRYQLVSVVNGDFKVIETPVSPIIQNNNFNKIALRYANDYALFVNGTKIAVDTNEPTFINNTLSQLNFGNADGTNQFYGRIRELIVFDNAPTDTELQTLTTP